jgi:hypothetical protein
MTGAARALLDRMRADLPAERDGNRLVAAVAAGEAPLRVIGALAAEEWHIVPSDRRGFLVLAARSSGSPAADFFTALAEGEKLALAKLPAMAQAAGVDAAGLATYEPRAGCQAYPAYVAWLALNAEPAEVVLALSANFAAWGSYCATLAGALRDRYGLTDEACGFVDFFAAPAPELERLSAVAIQAALDARVPLSAAHRYGRLLAGYEAMFWNTLAELLP